MLSLFGGNKVDNGGKSPSWWNWKLRYLEGRERKNADRKQNCLGLASFRKPHKDLICSVRRILEFTKKLFNANNSSTSRRECSMFGQQEKRKTCLRALVQKFSSLFAKVFCNKETPLRPKTLLSLYFYLNQESSWWQACQASRNIHKVSGCEGETWDLVMHATYSGSAVQDCFLQYGMINLGVSLGTSARLRWKVLSCLSLSSVWAGVKIKKEDAFVFHPERVFCCVEVPFFSWLDGLKYKWDSFCLVKCRVTVVKRCGKWGMACW